MPAHRHYFSMAHTAFAALIGLVLLSLPAAAFDFGTVTGGKINPLPIAINGFLPGQGADSQAQMITEVISNDLQHSGFFNPLPPDSFLEKIQSFDQTPNFQSWRQIQAQAMVVGQAYMDGGKIHVEFKLYDTASQQQLLGQQFTASPGVARRIAHRVADAIFQKLTGIDGYFDTRVVYVDESGPKDHRVKRIAIMDQDGYNPHPLTDGRDLVLTPRFSPNSQEIAYMSFGNNNPRVYIMNIDTKQREIVGEFPNMSFSPRFSPDGQKVIMSLQDGGNANIFELDLRSRQVRQVTNADSINTAPCYSPDGSQIVFESDRGGTQQIYLMGADGSGQNRISFGDGRYSTPVWSPDGKWIAFTKQANGKFAIGVMKPDGSGERILTEGFHNEGPTWAPNSHVVMFFRDSQGEKGGPQLFSVDVTGYNEQRIPTTEFASDPAWSPRLN